MRNPNQHLRSQSAQTNWCEKPTPEYVGNQRPSCRQEKSTNCRRQERQLDQGLVDGEQEALTRLGTGPLVADRLSEQMVIMFLDLVERGRVVPGEQFLLLKRAVTQIVRKSANSKLSNCQKRGSYGPTP